MSIRQKLQRARLGERLEFNNTLVLPTPATTTSSTQSTSTSTTNTLQVQNDQSCAELNTVQQQHQQQEQNIKSQEQMDTTIQKPLEDLQLIDLEEIALFNVMYDFMAKSHITLAGNDLVIDENKQNKQNNKRLLQTQMLETKSTTASLNKGNNNNNNSSHNTKLDNDEIYTPNPWVDGYLENFQTLAPLAEIHNTAPSQPNNVYISQSAGSINPYRELKNKFGDASVLLPINDVKKQMRAELNRFRLSGHGHHAMGQLDSILSRTKDSESVLAPGTWLLPAQSRVVFCPKYTKAANTLENQSDVDCIATTPLRLDIDKDLKFKSQQHQKLVAEQELAQQQKKANNLLVTDGDDDLDDDIFFDALEELVEQQEQSNIDNDNDDGDDDSQMVEPTDGLEDNNNITSPSSKSPTQQQQQNAKNNNKNKKAGKNTNNKKGKANNNNTKNNNKTTDVVSPTSTTTTITIGTTSTPNNNKNITTTNKKKKATNKDFFDEFEHHEEQRQKVDNAAQLRTRLRQHMLAQNDLDITGDGNNNNNNNGGGLAEYYSNDILYYVFMPSQNFTQQLYEFEQLQRLHDFHGTIAFCHQHPTLPQCLYHLSYIYEYHNRQQEAFNYIRQAVALFEHMFTTVESAPPTTTTINNNTNIDNNTTTSSLSSSNVVLKGKDLLQAILYGKVRFLTQIPTEHDFVHIINSNNEIEQMNFIKHTQHGNQQLIHCMGKVFARYAHFLCKKAASGSAYGFTMLTKQLSNYITITTPSSQNNKPLNYWNYSDGAGSKDFGVDGMRIFFDGDEIKPINNKLEEKKIITNISIEKISQFLSLPTTEMVVNMGNDSGALKYFADYYGLKGNRLLDTLYQSLYFSPTHTNTITRIIQTINQKYLPKQQQQQGNNGLTITTNVSSLAEMQYIQTCGILWPLLKGYKTADYLNNNNNPNNKNTQQQQKNNTKSEEKIQNPEQEEEQNQNNNNNNNNNNDTDKLTTYKQQLSTITTSAYSLKQLYPLVIAPTRWYVNGSYSTALAMMKLESMFNDKFETMHFTYEKPIKQSEMSNTDNDDDGIDNNNNNNTNDDDEISQDYSLSPFHPKNQYEIVKTWDLIKLLSLDIIDMGNNNTKTINGTSSSLSSSSQQQKQQKQQNDEIRPYLSKNYTLLGLDLRENGYGNTQSEEYLEQQRLIQEKSVLYKLFHYSNIKQTNPSKNNKNNNNNNNNNVVSRRYLNLSDNSLMLNYISRDVGVMNYNTIPIPGSKLSNFNTNNNFHKNFTSTNNTSNIYTSSLTSSSSSSTTTTTTTSQQQYNTDNFKSTSSSSAPQTQQAISASIKTRGVPPHYCTNKYSLYNQIPLEFSSVAYLARAIILYPEVIGELFGTSEHFKDVSYEIEYLTELYTKIPSKPDLMSSIMSYLASTSLSGIKNNKNNDNNDNEQKEKITYVDNNINNNFYDKHKLLYIQRFSSLLQQSIYHPFIKYSIKAAYRIVLDYTSTTYDNLNLSLQNIRNNIIYNNTYYKNRNGNNYHESLQNLEKSDYSDDATRIDTEDILQQGGVQGGQGQGMGGAGFGGAGFGGFFGDFGVGGGGNDDDNDAVSIMQQVAGLFGGGAAAAAASRSPTRDALMTMLEGRDVGIRRGGGRTTTDDRQQTRQIQQEVRRLQSLRDGLARSRQDIAAADNTAAPGGLPNIQDILQSFMGRINNNNNNNNNNDNNDDEVIDETFEDEDEDDSDDDEFYDPEALQGHLRELEQNLRNLGMSDEQIREILEEEQAQYFD